MKIVNNVSLYNNDTEIMEILSQIPPLEEYGNIPIVKYINENSEGKNVGGVILFNNKAYTFYKFDRKFFKEGDAGLILAVSNVKHALEQHMIFRAFKSSGMDISDKIFNQIEAGLVGMYMTSKFHKEANILTQEYFKNYFDEHASILSFEEILKMSEYDNGPLNNVIRGRHKHAFGVSIYEDANDDYYIYYINGSDEIEGLVVKINVGDEYRNEITFAFSKIINEKYPDDTDLIENYNTFQEQTKTLFEKLGLFTYGNELAGKTFLIKADESIKGVAYVPSLNKTDTFKDLFNDLLSKDDYFDGQNRVYLMFNPRNGYTKIGRSKNPKLREKTLQGEDPQTLILVTKICSVKREKELHTKYQHKRVRGEWFDLNIGDLIEIRELLKDY